MKRSLTAFATGLALLCAGCGGGGHSAAETKTACASATAAQAQYLRTGKRVALNFLKVTNDQRMVAVAGQFRLRVERLRRLTSGSEKEQLGELVNILQQHENLFKALAVHNLPAAHKYDEGLEPTLEQAQANFAKICKKA
jgi:DNA relaxase NicK